VNERAVHRIVKQLGHSGKHERSTTAHGFHQQFLAAPHPWDNVAAAGSAAAEATGEGGHGEIKDGSHFGDGAAMITRGTLLRLSMHFPKMTPVPFTLHT
jgi:hypothetical protein